MCDQYCPMPRYVFLSSIPRKSQPLFFSQSRSTWCTLKRNLLLFIDSIVFFLLSAFNFCPSAQIVALNRTDRNCRCIRVFVNSGGRCYCIIFKSAFTISVMIKSRGESRQFTRSADCPYYFVTA